MPFPKDSRNHLWKLHFSPSIKRTEINLKYIFCSKWGLYYWKKRGVKIERKLSFKRKRKRGPLFNNSSGHLLGFEPIVIESTTIYMPNSTSSIFFYLRSLLVVLLLIFNIGFKQKYMASKKKTKKNHNLEGQCKKKHLPEWPTSDCVISSIDKVSIFAFFSSKRRKLIYIKASFMWRKSNHIEEINPLPHGIYLVLMYIHIYKFI